MATLPPLDVPDDDRRVRQGWVRAHTTEQRLVQRARVVLRPLTARPTGRSPQTGLSQAAVGRWRGRCGTSPPPFLQAAASTWFASFVGGRRSGWPGSPPSARRRRVAGRASLAELGRPHKKVTEIGLDVSDLPGTPYSLAEAGQGAMQQIQSLTDRVVRLRSQGDLSQETLRGYFGDKRMEQITESNALEGSTLGVGETALAVLQGVTVTGHDPAYSRDAIALANALDRVVELARQPLPTDLEQLNEIHSLLLGDRRGAGLFRSERVTIGGALHRPPATWREIMAQMEEWEHWSLGNSGAGAILRAVVLHTWLTYVHPYIDGNGRAARAVLNLELIRAGFPSIIIRKKDRVRYLEALAESDSGGDLSLMTDLVLQRCEDALRDLERAARRHQAYDPQAVRAKEQQERRLSVWNDAVKLLFSLLREEAADAFEAAGGRVRARWYDDTLGLDDFIALSRGDAAGNSWLFQLDVAVPAVRDVQYLAWTGFRSDQMKHAGGLPPGPSIFWSVRDPSGHKRWLRAEEESPGAAEMTLDLPNIDRWKVRSASGDVENLRPSALVGRIVRDVWAAVER